MNRLIHCGIIVAALIPSPLIGQAFRVGVGGGLSTLIGDDINGEEVGFTLGGEFMVLRSSQMEFGLGLDYSKYGVRDLPKDLTEVNLLGILRYSPWLESVRPAFGIKAGISRHKVPLVTDLLMLTEASTYGFTVGPTLSLLVPMGRFGVEIGLDAMYMVYDGLDPKEPSVGLITPGSSYSGIRISGRAGLSMSLGMP